MVLILVGGGNLVMGAARTASVSGNWSNPATWGGGPIPIAGDNIIINTGVTVTVNVNTPLVTTVVINGSGTANGITISGTNTLNCGAITMTSPTAAVNSTIAVGSGTLNASGIAINGGAAAGRNCIVSVSTGTINLSGGITAGTLAQSQLTFTGAGSLNIGGNLANLTFAASTGTVNFNGSTPQTIQNVSPNTFNFSTLKINNAAGVTQGFDAKANTVIIGDVTPNSLFNQTNLFEPTGAAGTGTLTMVSGTWNCGTASNGCTFPKYGTYNLSTSTTIGYVAGVAQAVSVTPPYVNLVISGASTKTPDAGTLTVGGNLTINSGSTLDLVTHNNPLTVSGSINNSGTLNSGDYTVTTSIGGNFTQSGTATSNLTSNCSIGGNLNVGSGTIFAAGDPYSGHTPWLSVTGNTTVSGELDCYHGAKDFNGDVIVNSGGILAKKDGLNSYYSFHGNVKNNGTFNIINLSSASEVSFDGNGKTFSGSNPITVTNAIFKGSYTNSGTFTITNYLDGTASPFTGSGTFTQTSSGILNIGGISSVTTLNATATGNTVNYTGASQTVQAVNYSNLTLSGSGSDVLQAGTTSVNGNLTLSGTVSTTTAANMTVGGNIVLGTGTALTSGNGLNLSVAGNWTNNGSFTNNNGTVIFNGSGAQTIGGTSSTAFNNLRLSGTGAKGIPGGTSIGGNLSISTGALANLSNGINVPVGSLTMGGLNKINGTWGSTISPATYKDNIYYSSTTGIVTVTNDTRPTPTFSGITPNQGICFGTATVSLSGTVSAAGPIFAADGEIVSVTINGNTQNATISGGLGGFTINFPTTVIPASGTPYGITYAYPGDVNLKPISTNSTTLKVNALPTISGIVNICVSSSTQLTGSGTPALTNPWISGSTGVATVDNSGLVTGVSAGTSVITYNDINGCTRTATLSVNALPVITTQPEDELDCEGHIVSFNVVASGTGLTYTWQRKKPSGSFADIPSEPNVSYPSPGTIRLENVGNSDAPDGTQYRVVITNSDNCSITSSDATLTVNEIIGITPTATSVTICQGGNYSYTVTTSYPANVVSYQWKRWNNPGQWDYVMDGGAISCATTNHLVFTGATPSESGKYKVTVVFHSSGADCNVTSDTRDRELIVNPLASATPGGPDFICQSATPSPMPLSGAAIGGSATTGAWSITNLTPANGGANGTLSSTAQTSSPETVTYTPPANYAGIVTLTLTTIDPAGPCSGTSAARTITIKPLPVTSPIYHR